MERKALAKASSAMVAVVWVERDGVEEERWERVMIGGERLWSAVVEVLAR